MRLACTARTRPARPHRGGGRHERRAIARRIEVDLSARAVDQVAQRVAQLLREREVRREPELLTAGELARELRVERPWIYKHRHMLGGERLGSGPKAQWRFNPEEAKRRLAEHRLRPETTGA